MAVPLLVVGGIALRLALAAVGIGSTVYGLKKMNDIGESNMFNKGICPKCSVGHFEYKTEVTGSKAYKCDFCGNAVLLSTDVDKGYKYTPSKHSKNT